MTLHIGMGFPPLTPPRFPLPPSRLIEASMPEFAKPQDPKEWVRCAKSPRLGIHVEPGLGYPHMGASTRPVWAVEDGAVYDGPYRANIDAFLGHYGSVVALSCPSLNAWTVEVLDGKQSSSRPVRLYVYEDIATPQEAPVCDQCRIIGEDMLHGICEHPE